MSFDVNPLGLQMHLRQLEREAEHQRCLDRIQADESRHKKSEPIVGKIQKARVADILLALRHTS